MWNDTSIIETKHKNYFLAALSELEFSHLIVIKK